MTTHDPSEYIRQLQQILVSDKKKIAFLFGAGTSLWELAQVLVHRVKQNTSIDWTIKESVRAKLRTVIKRLLKEYGYPPDKQKLATENILQQAEFFCG